jgi:hypothetical protein
MVNGLDFTSEVFASLPPHFREEAHEYLTEDFLEDLMPGYKKKATGFKRCVPYLLASIVHHEEFLRGFLPQEHPIFRSRVFTHNVHIDALRKYVVTGLGRCPHTGMTATGVPTHLIIAKKIEAMINKIQELEIKIDEKLSEMADQLPADVSRRVSNDIRESFNIEGAVALHRGDLTTIFDSFSNNFKDQIDALKEEMKSQLDTLSVEHDHRKNKNGNVGHGGWAWKDFRETGEEKERIVPIGFQLPRKATVFGAFDLWYNGDVSTGIRPYRYINRKVDLDMKLSGENMMYTRLATVMATLEDLAIKHGCLQVGYVLGIDEKRQEIVIEENVSNIGDLTGKERDFLFVKVYSMFLTKYYFDNSVQRKNDLSFSRAYNKIVEYKKKNKE